MKSQAQLEKEAEEYFAQLKTEKPIADAACQYLCATMDTALKNQDYEQLFLLINYLEEGQGQIAFRHIGKTHRILRLLHIMQLEAGAGLPLFCEDCTDYESLREKYLLTLYALRRLLFKLSEASVADAVSYLQSRPISYLAAYIMTTGELLRPTKALYETLLTVYQSIWSDTEISQFIRLNQNTFSTPDNPQEAADEPL